VHAREARLRFSVLEVREDFGRSEGSSEAMILADTIDRIASFIDVFIGVYTLLILLYIISSWIRVPYSPWLNRVQRFLFDVCDPYLRLFRRILPPFGPLDLSPIVGVVVLYAINRIAHIVLDQFH
jgi:YggT family protein